MKIKELIELAKSFDPELDIAFWDVYAKNSGYCLDKVLDMEMYEYPNGYKEVRASVEEDYSK